MHRVFRFAAAITVLTLGACDSSRGTAAVLDPSLASASAVLVVSPANPNLTVGASIQLTATDSNGKTVTPKWSVSDTAVARISSSGLLFAKTVGTATVTARSGRAQGTTTVTARADTVITPPPPPPPPPTSSLVTECATPKSGWIWCDDFEQDRLARYFEYVSNSGSFTRASAVGLQSSTGMRSHFNAGQVSAGSLKLAFGRTPTSYMRPVDAGTSNYREIYWRVFVRNEPNWTGGGNKFTRAMIFANSNWAEAMIAHVWTGNTTLHLTMDPASGTDAAGTLKTTTYNDFANLRWLGARSGTTQLFDAAHVGQWHCVESHVRLNDAGASNGVFEFWVNGNLEATRNDLNWVGNYSAYGINSVFLENYWNSGSPKAQERYFDNLVVSTQRIGC